MNVEADIKLAVERATGCPVTHSESVPVLETFRGETVWQGMVEVFDVSEPPPAKAYGWAFKGEDETKFAAVLGVPPINTPLDAVRAWIVARLRK